MSATLELATLGKDSPGSILAVWQGSAVPSGVMVRNTFPQPFMHFFGRSS